MELQVIPMFPSGCGGCEGSCCKTVIGTRPPWTKEEVEHLRDFLPESLADFEFHLIDLERDVYEQGVCHFLTEDGRCGMQDAGFRMPEACSDLGYFKSRECLALRSKLELPIN